MPDMSARVAVDAAGKEIPSSGSVVVHDRMSLAKGIVWCVGPCHVPMRYGKARAMREMKRDWGGRGQRPQRLVRSKFRL
jgi:hypothetical protein